MPRMSFSFRLRARKVPAYGELRALIDMPDVVCEEEKPEKFVCVHLYRPLISTRSVEVSWDRGWLPFSKDTLEVRILANACAEDFALAMHILTRVASSLDVPVEDPEGMSLSITDLQAKFGEAWAAEMIEATANALARVASMKDEVAVPGPRRSFHVGPEVLKRLQVGTPGFHDRLVASMRRLQWIDGWVDDSAPAAEAKEATDGCYAASKMLVGGAFVLSVWVPNKEILLTPVDYVTFKSAAPDDQLILVPWSAIPELAGGLAEPLDEKHLLLKPCSDMEWTSLLERALEIAVPAGELKGLAGGAKA